MRALGWIIAWPGSSSRIRTSRAATRAKADLATAITAGFHGDGAAVAAADEFERRFAKKELNPEDLPVLEWALPEEPKAWRYLLVGLKLASSGGDADRKLTQGAVRLDGTKITDPQALQQGTLQRGATHVLQIGRHAYRLVVR